MQVSYVQFDADLLECALCTDEFKAPVVTKCGHTFCCDCYNELSRKTIKDLTCPTCRTPLIEKPAVNVALVSILDKMQRVTNPLPAAASIALELPVLAAPAKAAPVKAVALPVLGLASVAPKYEASSFDVPEKAAKLPAVNEKFKTALLMHKQLIVNNLLDMEIPRLVSLMPTFASYDTRAINLLWNDRDTKKFAVDALISMLLAHNDWKEFTQALAQFPKGGDVVSLLHTTKRAPRQKKSIFTYQKSLEENKQLLVKTLSKSRHFEVVLDKMVALWPSTHTSQVRDIYNSKPDGNQSASDIKEKAACRLFDAIIHTDLADDLIDLLGTYPDLSEAYVVFTLEPGKK